MNWIDQTRLDAEIAALSAKHERLWGLVLNLKLHDRLRREAVRQDSDRLRRDAERVLAHFDLCYARFFGEEKAGFNPDQPRVPVGNPDGGQWTGTGGQAAVRTRIAASDGPRPGSPLRSAAQLAKRLIEAYRSDHGLTDLFGRREGTVTVTTIHGKNIFGSNSTSPTYSSQDRLAATRMRDILVQKYPDVMSTDNIGRMPNDALFHAETTVLLRAAKENGGTLAGRELEIRADRMLCRSCDAVLPYVGRELGNPMVTFVGPDEVRKTMRDGVWID
jgi:hypothetical protein